MAGTKLEPADVEVLATEFYRRLGFVPELPVSTFRLARALLGSGAIVRGTNLVGVPAKVFTLNGLRHIAVSRKLSVKFAQFFVGHELGHIVLDELGYAEPDVERVCDLFGAAVMAPIPAVRAMLRAFGRDHEAIADEIGSTQTWAALRVAECLGIPRALVTPRKLYVRGPEGFEWGSEQDLRKLARSRVRRPGVTRARLTDDPARFVIDVDESDVG